MPGQDIYTLTPEQIAAWRKSAEPIVANWEADVKKVGGDPKAILRRSEEDRGGTQLRLLDQSITRNLRARSRALRPPTLFTLHELTGLPDDEA